MFVGKASWAEKCFTAKKILHFSPGLFLNQREMIGIYVVSVRIHCMPVQVDIGTGIALDFSDSRRQQTTKMP